jgi:cadmium resistance protein CadD (predicted permease)
MGFFFCTMMTYIHTEIFNHFFQFIPSILCIKYLLNACYSKNQESIKIILSSICFKADENE